MADLNNDGVVDEKDVAVAQTVAMQKAAEAKAAAEAAYALALEKGFFSHFGDYNAEIISPFKRLHGDGDLVGALNTIKDEALATVQVWKAPPANPRGGFATYNVFALVFGIIESLLYAFVGHGLFSLVWNGALGYAIAYTLYWIFLCSPPDAKLMKYSLIFVALYVSFSVYMTIQTLLFVIPAALYGVKAGLNLLQLICGFYIYKEAFPNDNLYSLV